MCCMILSIFRCLLRSQSGGAWSKFDTLSSLLHTLEFTSLFITLYSSCLFENLNLRVQLIQLMLHIEQCYILWSSSNVCNLYEYYILFLRRSDGIPIKVFTTALAIYAIKYAAEISHFYDEMSRLLWYTEPRNIFRFGFTLLRSRIIARYTGGTYRTKNAAMKRDGFMDAIVTGERVSLSREQIHERPREEHSSHPILQIAHKCWHIKRGGN